MFMLSSILTSSTQPTSFLSPFSIFSSSRNFFTLGDFNCYQPLWKSKGISDRCGEEVLDRVISLDFSPFNEPDTPTLLHRSSGGRCSLDIFWLPLLSTCCSWEVLQDLSSDYPPIRLTVTLSPVFCPNKRPPSFNFQKARCDDFAFHFDCHYPSAKEYYLFSLTSDAALFTSSPTT